MDFSKLAEWFKDKPPYILALCLTSGALLFLPDATRMALGLQGFVESQKGWVGATFLLSGFLLLSRGAFAIYEWLRPKFEHKMEVKALINGLKYLSPLEKGLLKRFLDADEKVLTLHVQDSTVNALEKRHVILKCQAGNIFAFPYMVQPCIYFHLKDHPELLNGFKEHR